MQNFSFSSTQRNALYVIIALFIVGSLIWWSTKPKDPVKKQQIFLVQVAKPKIEPMPVLLQTIGTVQAEQTVSITPQVTATIDKIDFKEGQVVHAGQLLFELNQSTFLPKLQLQQANLAKDTSQYNFDVIQAKRYAALYKKHVVTEEQYEQMQTTAQLQAATVEADQAQVNTAQTQLSYTEIRAPISGKIGNLNARVGDLVVANRSTPLEIINKMDPVLINFSFPQDQLTLIKRHQKLAPLDTEIYTQDGKIKLGSGKLTFVDNAVNPQNGTVLLKALVANPQKTLWPGEYVLVKLTLTVNPKAIVIPANAVQNDQNGNFVYLVKNNIVHATPVKVSRQMGTAAVIKHGLVANETVVTVISPGLDDGAKVKIAKAGA